MVWQKVKTSAAASNFNQAVTYDTSSTTVGFTQVTLTLNQKMKHKISFYSLQLQAIVTARSLLPALEDMI